MLGDSKKRAVVGFSEAGGNFGNAEESLTLSLPVNALPRWQQASVCAFELALRRWSRGDRMANAGASEDEDALRLANVRCLLLLNGRHFREARGQRPAETRVAAATRCSWGWRPAMVQEMNGSHLLVCSGAGVGGGRTRDGTTYMFCVPTGATQQPGDSSIERVPARATEQQDDPAGPVLAVWPSVSWFSKILEKFHQRPLQTSDDWFQSEEPNMACLDDATAR